jgi:N-acetylmuramoyl-L-alanine amidase
MPKFVIDAGHGLHTAGKRIPDESMREWEFNSAVATLVCDMLAEYENVITIRTDDVTGETDVPLGERTKKGIKALANLFISIHANAYGKGGFNMARGVETYVHPTCSPRTKEIASHIHDELVYRTGRRDRGLKSANFQVLRDTTNKEMSSVLVECGFMTNKEEAKLLKSDAYREKCAKAIVNALVKIYKLVKKVEKVEVQPEPMSSTKVLYRVFVNGTQVIALSDLDNLANFVKRCAERGEKEVRIEKV